MQAPGNSIIVVRRPVSSTACCAGHNLGQQDGDAGCTALVRTLCAGGHDALGSIDGRDGVGTLLEEKVEELNLRAPRTVGSGANRVLHNFIVNIIVRIFIYIICSNPFH